MKNLQLDMERVRSRTQGHGQKDKSIIAQAPKEPLKERILTDGNRRPMAALYEAIGPVDLVETLTDRLKDPLTKYRNKDGGIDAFKIPQKFYIVAIVYEIIEAAKRLELGLCVRHGGIYGFIGTHWVEIPDDEVKKYLGQMAVKLGYHSPADARVTKFKEDLFKQLLSDGIEEAPEPIREGPTLINLANGTLEIIGGTVKLREHRGEDFLTYCLPYRYEPEATAPLFGKYLDRVLPDQDSQKVIQEFLGYAFTSDLKLEKALVLYGSGGNGKSVLFEIVTAAFGKENISHKSLGELCAKGDKGGYNHRAEVENKLLNYSSEISPAGADIDTFKAITSQEPITAKRLYKDTFTYRPTVKMIFNANKLPSETERTDAFFRRFIIIPFEVTIPKDEIDVDLPKKIIAHELPGVLNWIVEGLKRISQGRKFTESKKAADALEAYKEESNSVAQFVKEYSVTPNPYEFIPNAELYRTYSEFCNEAGYKRLSQVNFGKEMKSQGFEPKMTRRNGKNARGFLIEIGE